MYLVDRSVNKKKGPYDILWFDMVCTFADVVLW